MAEWQPLALFSVQGIFYLIILGISIAGIIYSKQERKPAIIILFAVTAILPLMALRHLALFSLCTLVFIGPDIGNAWERLNPVHNPGGSILARLIGIPLIGIGVFLILSAANVRHIPLPGEDFPYPTSAVSIIKKSGVSGNLAVDLNWGEYVIWHLGPRIQVSMDGRRETVYSPKVYSQYIQFQYGIHNWDGLLSDYPTEIVLVAPSSATYNLMSLHPAWSLVYQDSASALFAKDGSKILEQLRTATVQELPAGDQFFP